MTAIIHRRWSWGHVELKTWVIPLAGAALLFLLYVGFDLRTRGMFPVDQALLYQSDYDEGVNVAAAQLMSQGYVPYRDFTFLQPPFAADFIALILRLHFVPWGDAAAFALARYAAIICGLLTLLAVFEVVRRLGGLLAALLSVAVLATDALVVQIDRQAMLEPYADVLSVCAILCFVIALGRERSRTRWVVAAGVLGMLAALTKTLAAAALSALVIYAVLRVLFFFVSWRIKRDPRERWIVSLRDLAALIGGAVVAGLSTAGYYLVTVPDQFLRQVYLVNFVRPLDGTVAVAQRFTEILGYPGSHLTVYLAIAGLGILLLRGILFRDIGHWGLIALWALILLALFGTARTYFPHYYVELAVPLAILAGGLASQAMSPVKPTSSHLRQAIMPALQIVAAVFLLVTNFSIAPAQITNARAVADMRTAGLRDVGQYIAAKTPPDAKVLALTPVYAFVGSREPAGLAAGSFLIDSYGYIIYTNVGMNDEGMPEPTDQDIWNVVHQQDAQAKIVEVAERADIVVIDRQARWELNPEIISTITAGRRQVFESNKITVFIGP